MPGSGQLGAVLCGHEEGEQINWGSFGRGETAGRLGGLEERDMCTHYFSHQLDQIQKAVYGKKGSSFCFVIFCFLVFGFFSSGLMGRSLSWGVWLKPWQQERVTRFPLLGRLSGGENMLTLGSISPLSFVFNPRVPGPWMVPPIFRKGLPTQLTASQTHLVDSTSSQVDNEKEPLNVRPLSI